MIKHLILILSIGLALGQKKQLPSWISMGMVYLNLKHARLQTDYEMKFLQGLVVLESGRSIRRTRVPTNRLRFIRMCSRSRKYVRCPTDDWWKHRKVKYLYSICKNNWCTIGKILKSANYDHIGDIGQLLLKGMKEVVIQLTSDGVFEKKESPLLSDNPKKLSPQFLKAWPPQLQNIINLSKTKSISDDELNIICMRFMIMMINLSFQRQRNWFKE